MTKVSRDKLPTEMQALVYWLSATGMTCLEIARQLNSSQKSVQEMLAKAKVKARKSGLSYILNLNKKEETPKAKKFDLAMALAREAKLI